MRVRVQYFRFLADFHSTRCFHAVSCDASCDAKHRCRQRVRSVTHDYRTWMLDESLRFVGKEVSVIRILIRCFCFCICLVHFLCDFFAAFFHAVYVVRSQVAQEPFSLKRRLCQAMAAVCLSCVLDGFATSRVSATLKRALSFRTIEIALRGNLQERQRPGPRAEVPRERVQKLTGCTSNSGRDRRGSQNCL